MTIPVGYMDECGERHVAGWVHDPARPGMRLPVRAELDGAVLAQGIAARRRADLHALGIGDGAHGFELLLPHPLTPEERARLTLHTEDGVLTRAPVVSPRRSLLSFVAMDIVENCNLRCPFCVYDYAETRRTNAMTEEVFEAALRLLPVTGAGHFWLSCLHEPTLHPRFAEFLRRLPAEHAPNVFFTTNLAKRMPATYYATLAASGLHHVNLSFESLEPATYERLRAGARFRIFRESWDALLAAFHAAPQPPGIRYNLMAYRSNLAELPGLVRHLIEDRDAMQVEIRDTMDRAHIPRDFAAAEYLDREGWLRLMDGLAGLPPEKLVVIAPPALVAELARDGRPAVLPNTAPGDATPRRLPRAHTPFHALVRASGEIMVMGRDPDGPGPDVIAAQCDLREIGDLDAFFEGIRYGS